MGEQQAQLATSQDAWASSKRSLRPARMHGRAASAACDQPGCMGEQQAQLATSQDAWASSKRSLRPARMHGRAASAACDQPGCMGEQQAQLATSQDAWGGNALGQLGNGVTTANANKTTPVLVNIQKLKKVAEK